ncbi:MULTISPECIES: lysophospholipid acyltransferase family protein [Streptomyces]|uniref:Lysophospholipid acyltransferase family protein n=1 Tax=Streptomyces thermogriseus TaxID=75292 RepID=A0ABN1T5D8_9ACTN|nr:MULTISPECIES: lysophospholipid acyltransferase family protein [Streptomyces]MDN5384832.1 lysophospholipid acyltransferase family protein [Streptomyces sp. LB8]
MLYDLLKYVLLGPLLRLLFRPRVEGLEHIPAEGAAIIAGNHLSALDPLLMPAVLKRRVTFLVKAEYFTAPGLKGRLTALVLGGAGQIPVDRSGRAAGETALQEGLRALERGELLAIYPEGTRSPDGRLYRGKVGVAVMALAARVPVIPCAMVKALGIRPRGRILPGPSPVTIRFGEPLHFSPRAEQEQQKAVLRAVTDEIMAAILRLSGQEYVDRYAAEVKAERAEERTRRRQD